MVADDERKTREEGLLNRQGCVLLPQRGHDQHVEAGEDLSQILMSERTADRLARRPPEDRAHARLVAGIAVIRQERTVEGESSPWIGQPPVGLRQDVHALGGNRSPDETDAHALARMARRHRHGLVAVLENLDAGHVQGSHAVAQEARGGDQDVGRPQHLPHLGKPLGDSAFAPLAGPREQAGRRRRERQPARHARRWPAARDLRPHAAQAAARRRAGADVELEIDKLAKRAQRPEVVQRDDDTRSPVAGREHDSRRKAREVPDVHDVRAEAVDDAGRDRSHERVPIGLEAGRCAMEIVEGQDTRSIPHRLDQIVIRTRHVLRTMQDDDLVMARQAARQRAGVDLGAAAALGRIGVMDQQDPQAHSG